MCKPTTDTATVRQVLRSLASAGWTPRRVYDGEEHVPTDTADAAVKAITDVDQAWLTVGTADGGDHGSVLFVLGNGDALDCVADFTTNLAGVIEPLMAGWR